MQSHPDSRSASASLTACKSRFFDSLRSLRDFGRRLLLGFGLAHAIDPSLRSGFRLRTPARLRFAHARKTAQNKTGAYSPPRFSAPALKSSRKRENQAAHLLPANLFAEQGASAHPTTRKSRVSGAPEEKFPNESKMPCRCDMGQYQSRLPVFT